MTEYISKEVALNELGELFTICSESLPNENGHHYVTEKELLIGYDHLCNIPPEDVVPIIRCKDCSYWNDWDSTGKKILGNYRCSCAYWTSEYGPTWYTAPVDFCSYAEEQEDTSDL